jgi:hypothetical protein
MATTNIQVDDRNLTNALRQLSRLTGVSFKKVVQFETGKILESAVKKTRAAEVKLIEANVRNTPARTLRNGKTYLMPNSKYTSKGWKLPDPIWALLQKQIKDGITKRKKSRGLSKKGWKQAAEKLGISIVAPSYVSKSTTTKGDYPANTTGREEKSGSRFSISLTNERTYDPLIFRAIRSAMASRLAYFNRNMKNEVFKQSATIATRYPGLRAS